MILWKSFKWSLTPSPPFGLSISGDEILQHFALDVALTLSQLSFASQMVRIVRSLDEIKEEFKDLQFLVDGLGETAGSLLTSQRLFKCTLDSIAVSLFVNAIY